MRASKIINFSLFRSATEVFLRKGGGVGSALNNLTTYIFLITESSELVFFDLTHFVSFLNSHFLETLLDLGDSFSQGKI